MEMGIGIAGLGMIGRVHAANLATQVRGAALARVVDVDEGTAAAIGREYDVPWSADVADLLDDPRVDAIVIATPPSTHADLVEAAAAAGKHVLCEKPLALRPDDAARAVAAAERAGTLLHVGFHRRHDPDFAALKRRIDAGDLGAVFSLFDSMRDPVPPSIEVLASGEASLLHDASCHNLDAARWLVGEVAEVTTYGSALSSPDVARVGEVDHVVIVLRFESGALGVVDNSLASGYGFESRCEIVGSRATARMHDPRVAHMHWLTPDGERRDYTQNFLERFAASYPIELRAFVDAVRGDGGGDAATGADGLAAAVLCHAAETSLKEGITVEVATRYGSGRPQGTSPGLGASPAFLETSGASTKGSL